MKVIFANDEGEVYDAMWVDDYDLSNDTSGMFTNAVELEFWDKMVGYLRWKEAHSNG